MKEYDETQRTPDGCPPGQHLFVIPTSAREWVWVAFSVVAHTYKQAKSLQATYATKRPIVPGEHVLELGK